MSIAISEGQAELAAMVRRFLEAEGAHEAGRTLLDSKVEPLPPFWQKLVDLGWLGLHLDERHGGSGFSIGELVVVLEELGRVTAPGPYLPAVTASSVVAFAGDDRQRARWLPGMADGSEIGALAFGGAAERNVDGGLNGRGLLVPGGNSATVLAVVVGDDVALVRRAATRVETTTQTSLDPTRRTVTLDLDVSAADLDMIIGGARLARALARVLVAAEAVGGAQACLEYSVAYAKERKQFGRPIGMFQAVKHHCADMLVHAESATAVVWDAARAFAGGDPEQIELAAEVAAAVAIPAFVRNAELNIQVHGGIGFTWEHDGHLLLRRALTLSGMVDPDAARDDLAATALRGVRRQHGMELPEEAEAFRAATRAAAERIVALEEPERRAELIDTGYVQPHWPRPFGRGAGALEQLVIDEEFERAQLDRPDYGITGWVLLTMIQHGTEGQIERFVRPTLDGTLVWCQLFSEPDAGSDAAGVRTRAVRADGGWLITGQKVWTSGAQHSQFGFATVRTDPQAKKHAGITTVIVDMAAAGVEVRPLREATGDAVFNEVFFDEVFIPDDDVVGPVNGGWTVARAALGNERVSIGGGSGTSSAVDVVDMYRRHAGDDRVLARELGALLAERSAVQAINLRRVERAVVGAGPGPEGNLTKLILAEHAQWTSDLARRILGARAVLDEGEAAAVLYAVLMSKALTIAGGTSEITRNQIGERILGLPRDPLLN